MDVREAVKLAKQQVTELLQEEGVKDIGLEEVETENDNSVWVITVGFSRPWDEPRFSAFTAVSPAFRRRSYKTIRISDSDKRLLSLKDPEKAA